MKNLGALRAFRALPCSLLAVILFATLVNAADDAGDSPERSLMPAAEASTKANAHQSNSYKSNSATYDLRYKLKRGDVLRYDVSHRASIRSTIDKTTESAQTRTDSVKAWKVTDVLPTGDIEFTNVVEKVHMVNQLPDHDPTEYDSSTDKTPPPGYEDAAKAVGVPISVMQITPHGKTIRRDLKVHNQGADNDAPIVLRLPDKRVAIGATWDEPFDLTVKLPDNGSKLIQTRRHHKLTDVKNGIATIEVTYQVLSPIDARIETQIVQKLMQGEVRFDIEKGQVVSQHMEIDKRIIGFAGPTSNMQYVMKMEEKLLKEDSPLAGKPKSSTTAKNGQQAAKNSRAQTANRPQKSSSKTIRR
jgi:hypothetical protein